MPPGIPPKNSMRGAILPARIGLNFSTVFKTNEISANDSNYLDIGDADSINSTLTCLPDDKPK